VSEVSREIFRGKQTQTLSSNFVNFNSFVFYAVKNSKSAVVGVVVGDGIVVNFGTEVIQTVSVCLQISDSLSSDYPVYDFASR
jgi:tetrahydrodipicolinate N-succinyltransferase